MKKQYQMPKMKEVQLKRRAALLDYSGEGAFNLPVEPPTDAKA